MMPADNEILNFFRALFSALRIEGKTEFKFNSMVLSEASWVALKASQDLGLFLGLRYRCKFRLFTEGFNSQDTLAPGEKFLSLPLVKNPNLFVLFDARKAEEILLTVLPDADLRKTFRETIPSLFVKTFESEIAELKEIALEKKIRYRN